MASFELIELHPPLSVATDVQDTGTLLVKLIDSKGIVAKRDYSKADEAEIAYERLRDLRTSLLEGTVYLEHELKQAPDSRPATEPTWYFDGCETPRKYSDDSVGAGIGCYLLAMVGAFIFIPFIGWLMMVLGVLALMVAGLVAVLNAVKDGRNAHTDQKTQFLRIARHSDAKRTLTTNEAGFGYLKPNSLSDRFADKIVCYACVGDRFVLAAAEPDPKRAAIAVGKEAARQIKEWRRRQLAISSELESARSIALEIERRETRQQ